MNDLPKLNICKIKKALKFFNAYYSIYKLTITTGLAGYTLCGLGA